ncbi:MAG: GspH/FimT family pseudopilin [Steroidobacteraceae bacterium]|nr:GspH/FimT family pseudopilin [Steroidobacteraceae bacterium]
MQARRNSYESGYTLLELMTALAILGVLLGIAVPSFQAYTRNSAATAAQNDLVTSLHFARSEALLRSRAVSVCASTDSLACSNSTDWSTGWIVFTDGGVAGVVDAADRVLRVGSTNVANVVLLSDARNAAVPASFIRYAATGLQSPVARRSFDIYGVDCTGPNRIQFDITPTGLGSVSKIACP